MTAPVEKQQDADGAVRCGSLTVVGPDYEPGNVRWATMSEQARNR